MGWNGWGGMGGVGWVVGGINTVRHCGRLSSLGVAALEPAWGSYPVSHCSGIPKLSNFIEAFRNTSHPYHSYVRRSYLNSVWLPQPRRAHLLVDEGEPFLISQRDYLRGAAK